MNNRALTAGVDEGARKYGNSRPVKRSINFRGIPISIEIEIGDHVVGNGWEKTYSVPYGEIPGSQTLADGEGVDVYIGTDVGAETVFVVHQNKRDGTYDEDKVFLGFNSVYDAVSAYLLHGPEWGFGSIDQMTVDQFKHGYLAANRVMENAGHKYEGKTAGGTVEIRCPFTGKRETVADTHEHRFYCDGCKLEVSYHEVNP